MIMYRRVDRNRPKTIPEELIDKEIRDLIEKENIEYKTKFKEWKLQQEMMNLPIFLADGTCYRIEFHETKTVKDVLSKVHTESKLIQKNIQLIDMRLRLYDGFKKRGAKPLTDNNVALKNLDITKNQAMFVEIRKSGEDFENWIPDQMLLQLMTYDEK